MIRLPLNPKLAATITQLRKVEEKLEHLQGLRTKYRSELIRVARKGRKVRDGTCVAFVKQGGDFVADVRFVSVTLLDAQRLRAAHPSVAEVFGKTSIRTTVIVY